MNPQSQEPAPNYDFIMQAGSPQKQRFGAGAPKKNRIIIVIGGVLLLVIVLIIFSYAVGAPKRKENAQMKQLAGIQTEMIRIANFGTSDGVSDATKAAAQTAAMTLSTDLAQTQSLMKKRGIKVSANELQAYKSTTVDTTIDTAKKANTLDSEFQKLFDEKLTNYQALLQQIYSTQSGTLTRESINGYYDHAGLLVFNYQPKTN